MHEIRLENGNKIVFVTQSHFRPQGQFGPKKTHSEITEVYLKSRLKDTNKSNVKLGFTSCRQRSAAWLPNVLRTIYVLVCISLHFQTKHCTIFHSRYLT